MYCMKTFGPFVLLLLIGNDLCLGQSFTQTLGGVSSETGIGAVVAGDGYRVGVSVYDQTTFRHSASLYSMGASGGLESSGPVGLSDEVFLQAQVNAVDGSFFLVGSTLPSGANDHDGLVVKVTADGQLAWTVAPIQPGSQQYLGGVALPDGGIVVCGITSGSNGHDVFVSRLGPEGAPLWSHSEPSGTDAEAHAVAVEGSTVMVTGRLRTFGGTDDVLFLRMDLDGTVIWSTSKGGSANEECRAIISAGDGTFVAAGWTNSYGMRDITRDTIPFHTYVIAIDLDGDTLWTKALGDTLFERHGYAMETAPNGDLLIAGERSTSGLSDALLLRLSPLGIPIWERSIDTGKEERIVHLLPLADGMLGTGWSFGEFSNQLLFIRRNADGF